MAEPTTTRLERWVLMQQKTWDVDAGSKATRLAVERPGGELVQGFSATADNLAIQLQDCLSMQAAELPASTSHQFRVVAYDDSNKQLAELPQTIRGQSKDASTANQHQLNQSRAHYQDVSTMSFAQDKLTALLDQVTTRLGEVFEDCNALAESNATMRLNNEDAARRREEDQRRWDRQDKLFEGLSEAAMMALPVLAQSIGPKLRGTKVAELVGAFADLNDKAKAPATPNEGTSNDGNPTDTSQEPASPVVRRVPESKPGRVSRHVEGRVARNSSPVRRKRGPSGQRPVPKSRPKVSRPKATKRK